MNKLSNKFRIMVTTHQSKFSMSSNLLFVTAGLVIISDIITRIFFTTETNSLFLIIINLVLIGSVGLIVRQRKVWTKFLPLILLILYIYEAFSFLINSEVNLIIKIIFVAQLILVTLATFILFFNFQKEDIKIA